MSVHRHTCTLLWTCCLFFLLTACRSGSTPIAIPTIVPNRPDTESPPIESPTQSATPFLPTATPAPDLPTITPVPMALSVNEEGITLTEYQAALDRFLAAQPEVSLEEANTRVVDEFIDQLLLSQAALEAGFVVDDALLDERMGQLVSQLGNHQALVDWWAANEYTETTFRLELARAIAAAWMRDRILAAVPEAVEQVHARQILIYNFGEAQSVYDQLQAGAEFDNMLLYYDPIGSGELGWFPRGYLLEPAIEEAAYALEPGEFSEIIETDLGFHIIQVIEKLPDRPLDPDAKLILQNQALRSWLKERREQSEISILVP